MKIALLYFSGICVPVAETMLTAHIPELEGRPKKNSHTSSKDMNWQDIRRHHPKMPHIKGKTCCYMKKFHGFT